MKKGKIKTQLQRLEEELKKSQTEIRKIDKLIEHCNDQVSKWQPYTHLKDLYIKDIDRDKKTLLNLRQTWVEHPSKFKEHQLLLSRASEKLPADKKEEIYRYIGMPEKKIIKITPKPDNRKELEYLAFDINTDDKTAKNSLRKLLKMK